MRNLKHFTLFLILLLTVSVLCGEEPYRYVYVEAAGGLRMRSGPDLNAEKMETIPNGTRVGIIEDGSDLLTIGGRSGRWTKVVYKKRAGWVFGGFLVTEPFIERIQGDPLQLPSELLSITFFPDMTFAGRCANGNDGKGLIKGKFRKEKEYTVSLDGIAFMKYQAEQLRKVTEKFKTSIEFKVIGKDIKIYSFHGGNTPCELKVKEGVVTDASGEETRYIELEQ